MNITAMGAVVRSLRTRFARRGVQCGLPCPRSTSWRQAIIQLRALGMVARCQGAAVSHSVTAILWKLRRLRNDPHPS